MTKQTQAIIYARFSPRRDEATCESNETQIDLCTEFCQQHEWAILGTFQDRALSGADADRPGIWEAIAALPKAGSLVVWRFDRLGRDVKLLMIIENLVVKKKGQIVSTAGEPTIAESMDDQDRLLWGILREFAAYERAVIRKRTSMAMLRHQANGRLMGHPRFAPYGMKVTGEPGSRRLVVNEEEQTLIRLIVEKRRAGMGYRPIARWLNEQGIKCRGGQWNHVTVRTICLK